MTLPIHVALIADGVKIALPELMTVAAALQRQATYDFGPIWNVDATVSAFASLETMPDGYWPIIIKDHLADPRAGGFHTDAQGQPFALVLYNDGWPKAASHECMEMLADPFGNRLIANEGKNYLVEVADPCEEGGYTVNNLLLSDFVTPAYYDAIRIPGVRYCFTGRLDGPRLLGRGGYISWNDPTTKHWWMRSWFGATPTEEDLGRLSSRSLRSGIDVVVRARKAGLH